MMFYIFVLCMQKWIKNEELVYQQNETSYNIISYLGNTNNDYNILIEHILNLKII